MNSTQSIFRLPRCVIEHMRCRRHREVAQRPELESIESRVLLTGMALHLAPVVPLQPAESAPAFAPRHEPTFHASYLVTHESAAIATAAGLSIKSGPTAQGGDATPVAMSPADTTDDDSDDDSNDGGDGDDGDDDDGDGDGGDDIDDENDPGGP